MGSNLNASAKLGCLTQSFTLINIRPFHLLQPNSLPPSQPLSTAEPCLKLDPDFCINHPQTAVSSCFGKGKVFQTSCSLHSAARPSSESPPPVGQAASHGIREWLFHQLGELTHIERGVGERPSLLKSSFGRSGGRSRSEDGITGGLLLEKSTPKALLNRG